MLAALTALSLAACSGSAPSTSPSAASDAPTAATTATAVASSYTSAAPSAVEGAVLIEAENVRFTPAQVEVPADEPFQIDFRNLDGGTLHNVEIKSAQGESVFRGQAFTGEAQEVYDVPALTGGIYPFVCSVHPEMTGSMTAE
jgi:plastocyanin